MIRDETAQPVTPTQPTLEPLAVGALRGGAKPTAQKQRTPQAGNTALTRLNPALTQRLAPTGIGLFGMQRKDPNASPLLGLQGTAAQRIPNRILPPGGAAAVPLPGGVQPIPSPLPTPETPAPVAPPEPVMSPLPVPETPSGPLSPYPMTNPNDPLTGRTIQRDPLVDRFNLAQDRFNTFVESTDPQYKAALRDANRYGAATGRLGSGDLRTDFGNLAQRRDLQMRTAQNQFLQDALGGTIDDQFRDIGIAQQQQGFQAGQQQQAFENELRLLGFTEEMINSAFGRALQQYMAGQSGGTGSATGIVVGQSMQNQGSNALDELNKLIRGGAMPTMPTQQPITTPPWAGGARG